MAAADVSFEVDEQDVVSVASGALVDGGDGAADDDGALVEQGQADPKLQSKEQSHATLRASRPSVAECLADVPDYELADLTLDVYNMFFLSGFVSQAFVYSLAVLITKSALYVLLTIDFARNKQFPFEQNIEADYTVQIAQFFLIPVAIVNQEELIASFFIFAHLKYSPEILQRHPGAYKWSTEISLSAEFVIAHTARFFDGLMFLILNTGVMLLEVRDVLQIFLNFAALQFLQSIDNIALEVCLNGYWTQSLQEAAQDVVDMKFAYRHRLTHRFMQMGFVVITWLVMLLIWARVHFICPSDILMIECWEEK
ncbi:hypothetical protein ACHAXT_003977 [Thalassiosira profunda]